ncbi:MAG TPA: DUF167 domain-containing protein [Acidimicrobiales bacterium]|nr:DUF167 domain-containing protein [Acidimicrobiales bacterium]
MVDDLFDSASDDSQVLRVNVSPGAGRTSVVGRHGDALKVRVAAPPEQGRANEECAELVAEIAGVAKSAVTLTSGATSRIKRFTIAGIDRDELGGRLRQALEESAAGGSRPAGRRRNRGGGRP